MIEIAGRYDEENSDFGNTSLTHDWNDWKC